MNLNIQAPLHITDQIKGACASLSPNYKPFYLNIKPENDLEPNQCFPNVAAKVQLGGGKSVYGWAVYLMPRLWIEFQSHAIWSPGDGTLVDPTPRADSERVVLFLPDDWQYTGQAPATQFKQLSDDPRLTEFFDLQREINFVYAENRPNHSTPGTRWPVNTGRIRELERQKVLLMSGLAYSVERNDPCPCMSRRKYKQCCGR